MLPGKVIPIGEARRRFAVKVRAKTRKARGGAAAWERAKAWLSSRATNGVTLVIGVLLGLALGALLASVTHAAP